MLKNMQKENIKEIEKIFKALSSETRIKIVKLLGRRNYTISEISKKLKISKVSVIKHVKVLENAGIIKRIKREREIELELIRTNLYKILDIFNFRYKVFAIHGETVLDVLRKVSKDVKIKVYNDSVFVYSIDNEDGNYIYEINGKLPDIPMNKFKLESDTRIIIRKIIPVKFKEIVVKLK